MLYSSTSEKIFEIGDKFYLVDLSFVEVHSKFGDRSIGIFFDGERFIEDELLKGHPFIVVSDPYKVEYTGEWYDNNDGKYNNGLSYTHDEYRVDVMICDCEDMPVLSMLNQRENIIEDYESYRNIIEELDFERLGGVL